MISTLVLNSNYQPVNVVSWKRALKKVINRRADIIYVHDGYYETFDFNTWLNFSTEKISNGVKERTINSGGYSLLIPPVIRALYYDDIKGISVKLTRKNLYLRDNYTCAYCGRKFKSHDLNIDHIHPRSRGGKHCWENVVCSCIKCNTRKDDMLLSECGMKLLKKPYIPLHNLSGEKVEGSRSWGPFVSDAYMFEGEIHDY